jgi:hypothetical protein
VIEGFFFRHLFAECVVIFLREAEMSLALSDHGPLEQLSLDPVLLLYERLQLLHIQALAFLPQPSGDECAHPYRL